MDLAATSSGNLWADGLFNFIEFHLLFILVSNLFIYYALVLYMQCLLVVFILLDFRLIFSNARLLFNHKVDAYLLFWTFTRADSFLKPYTVLVLQNKLHHYNFQYNAGTCFILPQI